MRRREFITLLGGAAVTWPLAARAQQPERVRRIGLLSFYAENDAEAPGYIAKFLEALEQLGWAHGRNVQIDYRWAGADRDRFQRYATESRGTQTGPDCWSEHSCSGGAATGDPRHSDRVCKCLRSNRQRFHRKPVSAWQPHYRLQQLRTRDGGQMGGIAQGDCTVRHPDRTHVQSSDVPASESLFALD